MMQGFVLTHQAGLDLATRPVRLSAAGMRDIRRQATRHGQLESITVAAMVATTSANVWLCGQITNEHAIRRLLAERGHVDDGRSGWLHHLYREYGYHGFALLEGLFAGALLDDGALVLFASKTPGPTLYYSIDAVSRTVWASTELKALPLALRTLLPLTDILARDASCQRHATCLADVWRVSAGYCVQIDLTDVPSASEQPYYSVLRTVNILDEATAASRIHATLSQVIQRLPGQHAHCLVSGGLDSSIVASLAQAHFTRLDLFTLGSTARNEFDKADALGRALGLPVTRLLIDESQFLHSLPEVIALVEHGFSTFIEYLIPVHLAHKQISSRADIMLSGYGSDVLFAGFAKAGHDTRTVAELVSSEYASTAWSNEASQCLGAAMGMEIGYPFFDSEVVDLAFAIDPYLKHKNGVEKYILRQAFHGKINAEVLWRPKVGIHEGTGCEDYFTGQLSERGADRTRLLKDALCHAVLREILEQDREPADIDMVALRQAVLAGVMPR